MKKRILALVLAVITAISILNVQNVRAGDGYPIYIEENDHGTVTANHTEAIAGTNITLTVEPNTGYKLKEIYVNDEKIDGTIFTMPEKSVVITPLFEKDDTKTYSITTTPNRYGKISVVDKDAHAGDKVVVKYYPLNGYIMNTFMLNGVEATLDKENAFTMPAENVTISMTFKKAIETPEVKLKAANNNSTGTSNWYFEYAEDAFYVTVKVIDATVIATGEPSYQDYVECMFNLDDGVTSWQTGKTVKYTVTAGNEAYMQKAISKVGFGRMVQVDAGFTYSVKQKQITNRDGYSGYEVQMKIPYELLGTTFEEAIGKIKVCPAYRNSESLVTRRWACAYDWFDVGAHYIVPTE